MCSFGGGGASLHHWHCLQWCTPHDNISQRKLKLNLTVVYGIVCCILELTHDASYQQRAGADMVTLAVRALCRHRRLHEAWSAHCGGGPQ